jgi:hypothetical protein
MKYLKMIGLGSVMAMALIAVTASIASATTLEITGAAQNQPVELTLSEKVGTDTSLKSTEGFNVATCTSGHTGLTTTSFTGSRVTAPVKTLMWFCGTLIVHNAGKLYIEHIPGTTDGTVFSEETHITFPTSFGWSNCQTGAGTDIGTLKGTASGNAILTINTVINCGVFLSSTVWKAEWIVTSPYGLGVVA